MPIFQDRSLDEQTESLANYLPGGQVFEGKNIEGTNTRNYLRGLATELQRFYTILQTSATEHDINQTQQLINEWESALGIPGTCFDTSGTLDQRRLHLIMKLRYMHGSTLADVVTLALLLGLVITIENPKTHGVLPAVLPMYLFPDGKTVEFTMLVHAHATNTLLGFPYNFPILFTSPNNALLTCLLNRIKPASVQVIYIYN